MNDDHLKDLQGSKAFKEKLLNYTDDQLKDAWIAQLESYEEQNKIYDSETNAQDWTKLMEAEANHRNLDLSTLESPDPD